ncbi:MAG: DUF3618 domain-containing protein [Pelagibaca sp.]
MPDVEELERNAEAHRAQLTDRISALAASVNPQAAAQRAVGQTTDLGQTVTKALMDGAKNAPSGFVLVGIGAAMIALNTGRTGTAKPKERDQMEAQQDRTARLTRPAQPGVEVQSASTLRKSLDKGLDKLPPEARARVTEARLKVIEAQEKLDRQARRSAEQARKAHQGQPLLTGVIAAGIGALIGSLLPSTKAETDLMGATRDRMMRDAEALFHAELAQLERQGKDAVETGLRKVGAEVSDPSKAVR